jgi:hypothetical protein
VCTGATSTAGTTTFALPGQDQFLEHTIPTANMGETNLSNSLQCDTAFIANNCANGASAQAPPNQAESEKSL